MNPKKHPLMITNLHNFVLSYIEKHNVTITSKTDLAKLRYDICKEFVKLGRVFSTDAFDHKLYPIVSTTRGRPRIGWTCCAHHNCSKCEFTNNESLRTHLTNLNAYKPFYTQSHEITETKYGCANGEFYCTSSMCDFKTPDENLMKQHLKLLGIEPYFKLGDPITVEEYYKFYMDTHEVVSPYTNFTKLAEMIDIMLAHGLKYNPEETCCCCLSERPSVIFIGCSHKVLCSGCVKKLSNRKCPICKKGFTNYINLDTGMSFYHPNNSSTPIPTIQQAQQSQSVPTAAMGALDISAGSGVPTNQEQNYCVSI